MGRADMQANGIACARTMTSPATNFDCYAVCARMFVHRTLMARADGQIPAIERAAEFCSATRSILELGIATAPVRADVVVVDVVAVMRTVKKVVCRWKHADRKRSVCNGLLFP